MYSVKRLKQKLQDRYGDFNYFSEIQGKGNVLCFRDLANYIISSTWHTDKMDNIHDEADRIVTTACKIIRAEIRNAVYDMDCYPTEGELRPQEKGLEMLPRALRLLLTGLIPHSVQTASIGQCILKAAKPHSVILPILLGLGVEMDHNFGSEWLINELARFGFSVNYNEVNRYKQSVVLGEKLEDMARYPYPGHFTQSVADNVDHNLITLDGKNSFHGMGIICFHPIWQVGSESRCQSGKVETCSIW